MKMRCCFTCGIEKPLSEFHNESRRPDGKRYECKICTNTRCNRHNKLPETRAKNNARNKANYAKPEVRRRLSLAKIKNRYGLSEREYDGMFAQQKGGCALCHRVKTLHVDHCHSSKRVRGLLCNACNVAIGLFRDDPDLIYSASVYVTPAMKIYTA